MPNSVLSGKGALLPASRIIIAALLKSCDRDFKKMSIEEAAGCIASRPVIGGRRICADDGRLGALLEDAIVCPSVFKSESDCMADYRIRCRVCMPNSVRDRALAIDIWDQLPEGEAYRQRLLYSAAELCSELFADCENWLYCEDLLEERMHVFDITLNGSKNTAGKISSSVMRTVAGENEEIVDDRLDLWHTTAIVSDREIGKSGAPVFRLIDLLFRDDSITTEERRRQLEELLGFRYVETLRSSTPEAPDEASVRLMLRPRRYSRLAKRMRKLLKKEIYPNEETLLQRYCPKQEWEAMRRAMDGCSDWDKLRGDVVSYLAYAEDRCAPIYVGA